MQTAAASVVVPIRPDRAPAERLITKKAIAEELSVSQRTIERWMRDENLPFSKPFSRGAVRFRRSEVLSWFACYEDLRAAGRAASRERRTDPAQSPIERKVIVLAQRTREARQETADAAGQVLELKGKLSQLDATVTELRIESATREATAATREASAANVTAELLRALAAVQAELSRRTDE